MRQNRQYLFNMSYLKLFGVLTGVAVDVSNFWSRSRSLTAWSTSEVGVWKRWLRSSVRQRWAWTGSGLDILQDTCEFWIRIAFGYLFLQKIGSGYLFDFYNKIFPRIIQDVTNDGAVVFFTIMIFIFTKYKMILLVRAALITIDDNSCYFVVNIFRQGGSSELPLYCWYAVLFCCAESSGICVCCVGQGRC